MKPPTIHLTLQAEPHSKEADVELFKKIVAGLDSVTRKAFDKNVRIILPGMDMTTSDVVEINAMWNKQNDGVVIKIDLGLSLASPG